MRGARACFGEEKKVVSRDGEINFFERRVCANEVNSQIRGRE